MLKSTALERSSQWNMVWTGNETIQPIGGDGVVDPREDDLLHHEAPGGVAVGRCGELVEEPLLLPCSGHPENQKIRS